MMLNYNPSSMKRRPKRLKVFGKVSRPNFVFFSFKRNQWCYDHHCVIIRLAWKISAEASDAGVTRFLSDDAIKRMLIPRRQDMRFFNRTLEDNIPEDMQEKVERIIWNPKFSVHVELVDAQHRELFAIMNRVVDLYESGSTDLLPVLQDLVQYSMDHFHAENMIMLKGAYPGVVNHCKEHAQFLEKVQSFLNDYLKQDDQLTRRMLTYIRDWLLSHTQKTDMKYADFFKQTGAFGRVTL